MDKEILKAFLGSITGNDIMKTNNADYGCVDAFMESDKYKELSQVDNINYDAVLGAGFVGNVTVKSAPVSERYWTAGDVARISNGQIRLGGCWFKLSDEYVIEACT